MARVRGTEGRADDAGDVDVNDDMVDSGVSGVSGVWGNDETEYSGALACTGTGGGGMGFGGDVDGGLLSVAPRARRTTASPVPGARAQ